MERIRSRSSTDDSSTNVCDSSTVKFSPFSVFGFGSCLNCLAMRQASLVQSLSEILFCHLVLLVFAVLFSQDFSMLIFINMFFLLFLSGILYLFF